MAIKIKLLDGETLTISADAETWNRAFTAALAEGGMIQIHADDGRVLAVNPQQVAYLEEVPDAAAEQEARQPEPAAR
ncbi:MAG: hypothetical protein ACLPV4_19335 [Solirubrobacteraceae bacterium]